MRGGQDAAIPHDMQIGPSAHEIDVDLVAAAVLVIRAVERLLDVSDEMDEPFQRLKPLAWRCRLVAQHGLKCADLCDDAVTGRAIATGVVALRRAVRRIDRDVDVVPARRLRSLRSDLVGPSRSLSKRRLVVDRQELSNLISPSALTASPAPARSAAAASIRPSLMASSAPSRSVAAG
jgi:hypothetical protein